MLLVLVAIGVVLCGLLGAVALLVGGADVERLPLGGLWPTWLAFVGVGGGFGVFVWIVHCVEDAL